MLKPFRKFLSFHHRWRIREYFLFSTLFVFIPGIILSLLLLNHILLRHYKTNDIKENFSSMNTLITRIIKEKLNYLEVQAAYLSALPNIGKYIANNDKEDLINLISNFTDKVKLDIYNYKIYYQFYNKNNISILKTWDLDSIDSNIDNNRKIPIITNAEHKTIKGIELGKWVGISLRASAPIRYNEKWVGDVETIMPLKFIFHTLPTNENWTIYFLADKKLYNSKNVINNLLITSNSTNKTIGNKFVIVTKTGNIDLKPYMTDCINNTILYKHYIFYQSVPIVDFSGHHIAKYILIYNGKGFFAKKRIVLAIFGVAFTFALFLLLGSAYLLTTKMENFFIELKKTVKNIAKGDFSKRISSKKTNCWEYLNCTNKNCIVYGNDYYLCYLAVGSDALFPEYKGQCLFIKNKTFKSCFDCPVYWKNSRNDIIEATNWFNCFVNIFSKFFTSSYEQLTEIFGSVSYKQQPTLHAIQDTMERLLNTSRFRKDIEGAQSQEEIYQQLSYIFTTTFKLKNFIIFQVNNSENRMEIVIHHNDLDVMPVLNELFVNPELCRAKRTAEAVDSNKNPILCPHKSIDTDQFFHYCLPVVMGGRIGMVVKFYDLRENYPNFKKNLPYLKKYLEEAAPILESQRLFQITRMQSLKDPLTSCYNRRFLEEYIMKYEHLAKRQGNIVGIFMLDLDHFKKVNDTYGHQAGDTILKTFAEIVKNTLRASDLVFRYGGEEFVVVLPEIKEGTGVNIAEKVRANVESTPIRVDDGQIVSITVTIGVAEFPKDSPSLKKAIKLADVALYVAKKQGRNKVSRFTQDMWSESEETN